MSSLSFWLGYRNVNTKLKVFVGVGQWAEYKRKNFPAKHCSPRYCAHSNAIHVNQHPKVTAPTASSFDKGFRLIQ